jgi:hypothetical protein
MKNEIEPLQINFIKLQDESNQSIQQLKNENLLQKTFQIEKKSFNIFKSSQIRMNLSNKEYSSLK